METTAAIRRRFADLRRPLRALVAFAVVLISLVSIGSTNAMTYTASSSGATYYVAPSGSDASACTSTQPCATLNRAVSLASSGGAVSVAGGTYTAQTIQSQAPQSTVTIASAPGQLAVLTQLNILNSSNIVVLGSSRNAGSQPRTLLDPLQGITLVPHPSTVQDFGGGTGSTMGIYVASCSRNITIDGVDAVFYDVNHANSVTFENAADGGHTGTSHDSTVGPDYRPTAASAQRDPCPSSNPSGILYRNVLFHDSYAGVATGAHPDLFQVSGADSLTWDGDSFVRGETSDIMARPATNIFYGAHLGTTPGSITLRNSFLGPLTKSGNITVFGAPTDSCGGVDVLYNSAVGLGLNCGTYSTGPRVVGNAFTGTSSFICSTWLGKASLFDHNQFGAGVQCGTHSSVISNTNFASAAASDFHINASSGLIGTGENTFCPTTDIDGNPRPTTSPCTAGADQLVPTDTTPPVLSNVPSSRTVEATGPAGAPVAYAMPTATDNVDPSPSVSCSPSSGSTFSLGTTSVTCTAGDASGNTSSAVFQITVRDTTAPALSLPGAQTIEATGPAGAVGTFGVTATDAVDPKPTVTCVPSAGSTFPIGSTSVQCTATDASGNAATGSFSVSVVDTTAPTAPANPATANVTTGSGDLTWSPSTDAVGVTGYDLWLDGNAAGTTTGTRSTFSGLMCGTTHTLTVAAHDAAGNESAPSTATVTTVSCPPSVPMPTQVGLLNHSSSTGTASDSMTLAAIPAGDTVLVTVAGNAYQPSGVKDSLGNTYALDTASGTADPGSSMAVYRFRYPAAVASATLTLTWAGPLAQHQATAYAVPSLVPAPLDAHAAAGAKTTAPGATAPPSRQVNEVAVAAFRVNELTWAGTGWAPGGWTPLTNVFAGSLVGHLMVAYKLMPAPATASLGFSIGGTARDWSSVIATYVGS